MVKTKLFSDIMYEFICLLNIFSTYIIAQIDRKYIAISRNSNHLWRSMFSRKTYW